MTAAHWYSIDSPVTRGWWQLRRNGEVLAQAQPYAGRAIVHVYPSDQPWEARQGPAWSRESGTLSGGCGRGACWASDLEKTKPYMRELFYIRGILRKRIYVNEWYALQLLEDAHLEGASFQSLRGLAKSCRNWTEFQADIRDYIDGARGAAA